MPDLKSRERIAWAGMIGAVLGVVAFFFVSYWVDRSFFPSVVADEDYGYEYLFRLPMGIFLGAMTGIVVSPVWQRPAITLARVCAALNLGFMLGLWLLFTPVPDQSFAVRRFYVTVPFLWAASLVLWSAGTLLHGHLIHCHLLQGHPPKTSRAFSMACCGLVLLLIGASGWSVYGARRQAQENNDLIAAIKRGDPGAVERLLDEGADANAREVAGRRTFWQRVRDLLLRRTPPGKGRSALVIVLQTYRCFDQGGDEWKWEERLLRSLLKHGADPNLKDQLGITPLMWGCEADDKPLVKLALERGAQVNVQDYLGDTALTFATDDGNGWLVQVLLDHGADVNRKDASGGTALMLATCGQHPCLAIVKVLLRRGAQVNVRDKWGVTPLKAAVEYDPPRLIGRRDLVSLLKQYGAKQ